MPADPKIHYKPQDTPPWDHRVTACSLPRSVAEDQVTADVTLVTCKSCRHTVWYRGALREPAVLNPEFLPGETP